MKGKKQISWTKEQEIAFSNCKRSLERTMELAHPDPAAELILTMDALDIAIGAANGPDKQGGSNHWPS